MKNLPVHCRSCYIIGRMMFLIRPGYAELSDRISPPFLRVKSLLLRSFQGEISVFELVKSVKSAWKSSESFNDSHFNPPGNSWNPRFFRFFTAKFAEFSPRPRLHFRDPGGGRSLHGGLGGWRRDLPSGGPVASGSMGPGGYYCFNIMVSH